MYCYVCCLSFEHLGNREYQCFLEPLGNHVMYRSNYLFADLCHSVFTLGRCYCL